MNTENVCLNSSIEVLKLENDLNGLFHICSCMAAFFVPGCGIPTSYSDCQKCKNKVGGNEQHELFEREGYYIVIRDDNVNKRKSDENKCAIIGVPENRRINLSTLEHLFKFPLPVKEQIEKGLLTQPTSNEKLTDLL